MSGKLAAEMRALLMDLTDKNNPQGYYQTVVEVLCPSNVNHLAVQATEVLALVDESQMPKGYSYYVSQHGLLAEPSRRKAPTKAARFAPLLKKAWDKNLPNLVKLFNENRAVADLLYMNSY